jgi:hypothetical protein
MDLPAQGLGMDRHAHILCDGQFHYSDQTQFDVDVHDTRCAANATR